MVFTLLRFVHGLFLNQTGLIIVHLQEQMPLHLRSQVLVINNCFYSLVLISLAFACGHLTDLDWRIEAMVWYGLPMVLGLFIAFPNWMEVLASVPQRACRLFELKGSSASNAESELSPVELQQGFFSSVGFFACGCGFYGLSYSAGQISTDPYMCTILLSAADILGYVACLSANSWGRSRVQAGGFFLAALCLFLCSTGERGSSFVISFAVLGRLCLDACFTLVYVGLVEIFSESAQKKVLPACEITARLGGVVAPYCGTLPAFISCPIFGAICLLGTWATLQQGDAVRREPGAEELGEERELVLHASER